MIISHYTVLVIIRDTETNINEIKLTFRQNESC